MSSEIVMAVRRTPPATPKRALDRQRIELAALALIEKRGLAQFSMRKLGAALEVEAMSLYHHFPSKAHLLDALVDRLIGEITDAASGARPFRERVRRACIAYRDVALRHPEFARFMIVHRMNTRATLTWLESIARIFLEAGFDVESAARAFRIVGYYMMGAVLDETSGYAKGPTATEPLDLAEQASIAPSATRFGPYFQREEWERTFLLGLELLLDGFERTLAASSAVHADR